MQLEICMVIQDVLSVIDYHNPAGTSVRTTAHLAYNHNSGEPCIEESYVMPNRYR